MTQDPPASKVAPSRAARKPDESREARLAAALRANLARRKAQARSRAEGETGDARDQQPVADQAAVDEAGPGPEGQV